MLSRLESLILRMSSQRDSLNEAIRMVFNQPGLVLEVGLGSGRTYDHLRKKLSRHDVYAFDHRVECHPSCTPPEQFMVPGNILLTLPEFAQNKPNSCCLIHMDIGTKDYAADLRTYAQLLPSLEALLIPGGFIASDRPLNSKRLSPLIENYHKDWPYYLYSSAHSLQTKS